MAGEFNPSSGQPPLPVGEFSGTARSGKGTIVEGLAKLNPSVVSLETGLGYRFLSRALLDDGVVELDMQEGDVLSAVQPLRYDYLAGLLSTRDDYVALHGKDSLYGADVQGMVSKVSPDETVRKVVKADFRESVENIVASGQSQVLLVDGRNLAPIIKSIPGAQLIMRTFVACSNQEAAAREARRDGISLASPEFKVILDRTTNRNRNDADREIDPVLPDEDAIGYWYARSLGTPVGVLAARTGQQILHDTSRYVELYGDCTEKAISAMVAASNTMLRQVLAASSHSLELAQA
jgi:cytidylate kinase